MRWLAQVSTGRPVAVTMLILVFVVFGMFSFQRLSIDLLPDMNMPIVAVITTYQGAGPAEIERLISKPVEEAVSTITNVKNVRSTSQEGTSFVMVEFDYSADIDYAALQVREKAEQIRGALPDDAKAPMVFKFDPGMMPVMFMGVGGKSDTVSLRRLAEDTIKPALERIPGVAAVDVSGGDEEEIRVTLDQEMLAQYGLTFSDISRTLIAENVNVPGGSAESGKSVYSVRTLGEFRSVDEIGDIIVGSSSGVTVHLRDVARVERTIAESNSFSRMNGKSSVGIQIRKQSGASSVTVSRLVRREIAALTRTLPASTEIKTVFDQATYTQRAIDAVYNSAYQGSFLAVAVLYVFLQSLRHTLVIGVSIPISIIVTFLMMYMAKLTINMMSLGGLALGVGMMVDNSIVVLENIYRYAEEGHDPWTSCVEGTIEVGGSIWGSTITNVAVFLPILFVSGFIGQIFRELALTVTFSLLASLIVAVTVIPMVCYRILLVSGGQTRENVQGRLGRFLKLVQRWTNDAIPASYQRMLKWALSRRAIVVGIAVLSIVLTVGAARYVGQEYMPSTDEGQISISVEMPPGTKIGETNQVVSVIEKELASMKEVDAVFANAGGGGGMGGSGTHRASIEVQLVPKAQRTVSTAQVVELLRKKTAGMAGAKIRISSSGMFSMGGSGAGVSLAFKGPDIEMLEQITDRAIQIVSSVQGTRNVRSSIEARLPEAQVLVDREKAASSGLTTYEVASAIRTALTGQVTTNYRVAGNEIAVRLRLPESQRKQIDDLKRLRIPTAFGTTVSLADVATIKTSVGPTAITRENQSRVVTVSCSIAGRDLSSVTRDVALEMEKMGTLPPGYTWEFAGQAHEMAESFKDLGLALLLALLIIYMLLAAQFESLLQPLVIMLTVPLAALGGVWGLFLTGRTLNIIAYTGFIMLVGITVNNGIVLVEYVNILRRRDGMAKRDALMKAGPNRLRPILMTSLTTILGLLPLCLGLGEGSEMEAPLATVIAAGLATSTLLTLIVVPVTYDLLETLSDWISRKVYGKNAGRAPGGNGAKPVASQAGGSAV